MRRKTRAVHTMQKHRKTFPHAQIAANKDCPTASAQVVDNTRAKHLQHRLKIGIDLMGNENAPQTILDALKSLLLPPHVEVVVLGLPELEAEASPLTFVPAPQVIELEDHPLLSLRRKRNSSINIGLRMVKEGKLDAFISAGNTGALVSSAKMVLSMLPKVLRPCLIALMPTKKNPVAVLDVGANVQVKSQQLVQFACIGTAYQKACGVPHPKVGLLNIGSEPLKGTSELRIAYQKLQSLPIHFVGNVEGTSVFNGDVDVLVTDGFTGNVLLKTAEGIASLIFDRIQLPPSELKRFQTLHYSEGALLAGVKGIVIKCHSYASPKCFQNAVLGAIRLVQEGFVQKLINDLP